MFAGKPIIGVIGGIGSGKSLVARCLGELGCVVIDSDALARRAYEREDVRRTVAEWWGGGMLNADGSVNRPAIGRRVFADEAARKRLEQLVHPIISGLRDEIMTAKAGDAGVPAFVWDAPLLVEAGLAKSCDAIVFVDAPLELREKRVRESRGWDEAELKRREKWQMALDKKRQIAKYIVRNTAGVDEVRSQVREVLSRIVAGMPDGEPKRAAE